MLLAALYSASVRRRIALGPRTGQQDLRLGDRVDVEDMEAGKKDRCSTRTGLGLERTLILLPTDLGEITFDLLEEVAPEHVENFVDLARRGAAARGGGEREKARRRP